MSKQSQAFLNLFLAIYEENGYYDNLRKWAKGKGYNPADMASMLNDSYEDIPDGMSPYYYMDSLEDMLSGQSYKTTQKQFNDIDDMVQYVYDNELWKE